MPQKTNLYKRNLGAHGLRSSEPAKSSTNSTASASASTTNFTKGTFDESKLPESEKQDFWTFLLDRCKEQNVPEEFAGDNRNSTTLYEKFREKCGSVIGPYVEGSYQAYKDSQKESTNDQKTAGGSSAGTSGTSQK